MGLDWSEFLFGSEGEPGSHGIDTAYLEEYDDGVRESLTGYWNKILNPDEYGDPDFLSSYLPGLKKNQENLLRKNTFGPGGIRDYANQIGSVTGLDQNETAALQQGFSQDYGYGQEGIEENYGKFKLDFLKNAQNQASYGLAGLPSSPSSVSSGYSYAPQAGQGGLVQDLAGSVGSFYGGKLAAGSKVG